MATTPHVDPPKHSQHQDDKARSDKEAAARKDAERKDVAHQADPHQDAHKADEHEAAQKEKPKYPILPEGQAYELFRNGHKVAKEGSPPSQWFMMGRLPDGTACAQSPVTPELEKQLKEGKYYVADGLTDPPPPPEVTSHHDPL